MLILKCTFGNLWPLVFYGRYVPSTETQIVHETSPARAQHNHFDLQIFVAAIPHRQAVFEGLMRAFARWCTDQKLVDMSGDST